MEPELNAADLTNTQSPPPSIAGSATLHSRGSEANETIDRITSAKFAFSKKIKLLRLMTTYEKSSLTGPETFMVVFSHEKEEGSVKK